MVAQQEMVGMAGEKAAAAEAATAASSLRRARNRWVVFWGEDG